MVQKDNDTYYIVNTEFAVPYHVPVQRLMDGRDHFPIQENSSGCGAESRVPTENTDGFASLPDVVSNLSLSTFSNDDMPEDGHIQQPQSPDGESEHKFQEALGAINRSRANTLTDSSNNYSELRSSYGSSKMDSMECATCKANFTKAPECEEFWNSVPNGGDKDGCHIKFLDNIVEKLIEKYGRDKAFGSKTTMNLMKIMLQVDLKEAAPTVKLSDFVVLCLNFGPLKKDGDGRCILLQSLEDVALKSLKSKKKKSKEKISWFAGQMSRQEANQKLQSKDEGTFLVRTSGTDLGKFVVSVAMENEDPQHFIIERDHELSARSKPFSACLELSGTQFHSLVQLIDRLLDPTDPFLLKERDRVETDEGVQCVKICPDLPLNGVITGYK